MLHLLSFHLTLLAVSPERHTQHQCWDHLPIYLLFMYTNTNKEHTYWSNIYTQNYRKITLGTILTKLAKTQKCTDLGVVKCLELLTMIWSDLKVILSISTWFDLIWPFIYTFRFDLTWFDFFLKVQRFDLIWFDLNFFKEHVLWLDLIWVQKPWFVHP